MSADTRMHFSFYRDPEGRETASSTGFSESGPRVRIERGTELFQALQATVHAYDETH